MVCSASGSRIGWAGSAGQTFEYGVAGLPGPGADDAAEVVASGCGSVTRPSDSTARTDGSDRRRVRSAFEMRAENAFRVVYRCVTAPPARATLAISGRCWRRTAAA